MVRQTNRTRKLNKKLSHKSKSKKYHSIESKLKILDYSSGHGKHSAAKSFKIDRSQIRKLENKNQIGLS